MTALVIASDDLSATRAAAELGLVVWHTPAQYAFLPVDVVIWVDGWGASVVPVAAATITLDAYPRARHMVYQFDDERELTNARRAGERLDVLRGIRAYRRRLAALPPTLSPEAMASATTITPERAPWWRRLFRKATR